MVTLPAYRTFGKVWLETLSDHCLAEAEICVRESLVDSAGTSFKTQIIDIISSINQHYLVSTIIAHLSNSEFNHR